jgi:iron complex transport system permease protein
MTHNSNERFLILSGFGLVFLVMVSIFIGRYPHPYWMPPLTLFQDDLARQLVTSLRLPRLLTAMLLGMILSACGSVLQMIFRNPLVEPGFLGVSQGAAFGAALSILWLGHHPLFMEITATLFGLLGLFLSHFLSNHLQFGGWVLRLILSGMAVSALFSAGVGAMKYVADPLTQLPDLTFWLLGGLWGVTWSDFLYVLPFALLGLVTVFLMRWRLNLLALNDETAFSLGAILSRERLILLIAIVAATSAITSISGIIGWVGLIVPHIARRLSGASAHKSVPVALLLGGIFTVISDDLARSLLPGEIPLGILTSVIGAVLFIFFMTKAPLKVRA